MRSRTDSLLVITFTLIIITSAWFLQTRTNKITGFAGASAEICVGNTPQLIAIGNLTAYSGVPFSYDVNHTVTNNDAVTYRDTAVFFAIDQSTGEIGFTPQEADEGNHTVGITVNNSVCEAFGDSEVINFEIIVSNHAPVLDFIPDQEVWEEGVCEPGGTPELCPLYLQINATDADGDSITFACNTSADAPFNQFTVNETTGVIWGWDLLGVVWAEGWIPSTDSGGKTYWFDCNATDFLGAYDSQVFSIYVRNDNDDPVINPIPDFRVNNSLELYEDQQFEYQVTATDADGDIIVFSDTTELFNIALNGWIIFTPSNAKVGNHTVNIFARDFDSEGNWMGGLASATVLFEIIPVNDPPSFPNITSQTAQSNSLFVLQINGTDEEDRSALLQMTWSDDTPLFDISSYDLMTGLISFTPAEADIGNYTINITVTDNGIPAYNLPSASYSQAFSLAIVETNRPPNITSYSPTDLTPEITTTQCQDFSVTVTDPDGGDPTVMWYLDSVFTNTTGTSYSYCPASAGTYNITIVATDGALEAIMEWSLNVTEVVTPPGPGGPDGDGGGGGGGGKYFCDEAWACADWSSCMISDIQIRTCEDLRKCGTELHKPPQTRSCIYTPYPTCFDSILNQNEILTDCGGVCKPCPTCNDGICNQGELCEICDIDPAKCPRDLENNVIVDCGGPCPLCPRIEKPVRPKTTDWKAKAISITEIVVGSLLVLLIAIIITVRIMRYISKRSVLTEQEQAESGIVNEISNLVDQAENAVDAKDMERLKTACSEIERLYNSLTSVKNKKKIYPKIVKLQRIIKIGF